MILRASYLLMLGLFSAHSLFDCLCTVSTLFLYTSQSVWWGAETLALFYPRLLLFTDDGQSLSITKAYDPLLARTFIYYVACMSLVRVVAVCMPGPGTCACVAVMYAMQALAAEYEGFSAKTSPPHACRVICYLCTVMSICSALLAFGLA